jgi:acetyl/propionyl-CoA carboxylase alpha subunit
MLEIALEGGAFHTVDVARHGDHATVTIDGRDHRGSLRRAGDGYVLTFDDRTERLWILVERDTVFVHGFGRSWTLGVVDPVERARKGHDGGDVSTAPMPGTVVAVHAEPGQHVHAGEALIVIESMKMESVIAAPRDGVVDRLLVSVGDTFDRGAPLVALQPEEQEDA